MANKNKKAPENALGKFYIDTECCACGVCSDDAPANIKMSQDGSHAYVYNQPKNEAEKIQILSALDNCPTEAIGADGE